MFEGFSKNESKGSGKFVSIADGKFKIKVSEGTEGATARTKEDGTEVHELVFDKLTAVIKDIKVVDFDYNGAISKKLEVSVTTANGDDYSISMNYASSYAITLLRNLTSDKFIASKAVELAPYSFETNENGKEKKMIGISIKQDGEKLKSRFENTDVPAWKEFMVNGTKTFDKTDQLEFLLKNVNLANEGNTFEDFAPKDTAEDDNF
jgi:hypothetical protein